MGNHPQSLFTVLLDWNIPISGLLFIRWHCRSALFFILLICVQ